MKTCTKCLIEKVLTEYRKAPRYAGGLSSWCKSCTREYKSSWKEKNKEKLYAQDRQYKSENRERVNENARRRATEERERDPEAPRGRARRWRKANPEKIRAYSRENYDRHSERYAEDRRNNYAKDPTKAKAASKAWRDANPERRFALESYRRALKRKSIPPWEVDVKEKETEWRRSNPGMSLDHVVPTVPPLAETLGGKPLNWRRRSRFVGPLIPLVYGFHTVANWAPLSFRENSRKGNRDWPDSPWS